MNLKEEIYKRHKWLSEIYDENQYILSQDAIDIAEAYAKGRARDAYWEATLRFANTSVVLSKNGIDVDFEKWWEENK